MSCPGSMVVGTMSIDTSKGNRQEIECIFLIGMQMLRGELEQDVVSRRQGEACQGDTCL